MAFGKLGSGFGRLGIPLGGAIQLPPIPDGFTLTSDGFLLDSGGQLWVYVIDSDGVYLVDDTGAFYIDPFYDVNNPPIPQGFSFNQSGFLVRASDSSQWVYVVDNDGAFLTDAAGNPYLDAA